MVGGEWCSGIVCTDGFSGSEDLGGGDGDDGVVSLFMMFCEMVGLACRGQQGGCGWQDEFSRHFLYLGYAVLVKVLL